MGVGDLMKAEAEEDANRHLESRGRTYARAVSGDRARAAIRTGKRAEEILKLIEEDEDISFLVLAAGTSNEGPGPLVTYAGEGGRVVPVPIAIVPRQPRGRGNRRAGVRFRAEFAAQSSALMSSNRRSKRAATLMQKPC